MTETNRRHKCQVTTCIRRRGAMAGRDRTIRRTSLASTTSARARHPPTPRLRDEARDTLVVRSTLSSAGRSISIRRLGSTSPASSPEVSRRTPASQTTSHSPTSALRTDFSPHASPWWGFPSRSISQTGRCLALASPGRQRPRCRIPDRRRHGELLPEILDGLATLPRSDSSTITIRQMKTVGVR